MKSHDKTLPAHEQTHSVRDVALILGIGKDRLFNAMKDAGMKTSEQITVAQGFAALSAKFQKEDDRNRRQKAEADSAELDAAEKAGRLMLKKDAALIWADATIEVRRKILSKPSWKSSELVVELGKIKLEA